MRTRKRFTSAAAACAAIVACSAVLSAPAGGQEEPVALRIVAENVTAREQGRLPAEGADAPASRPGDVIEYRLLFTNITTEAIRNVVFDDPIPAGLSYIGSSAGADREDVVVEFSIDGGGTYASRPEIEVQEQGRTVLRPAPPERYTHIRWTVQGTVARGEAVRAQFRARISSRTESTD